MPVTAHSPAYGFGSQQKIRSDIRGLRIGTEQHTLPACHRCMPVRGPAESFEGLTVRGCIDWSSRRGMIRYYAGGRVWLQRVHTWQPLVLRMEQ